MDRKDFIRHCGFACLGAVAVSVLGESCSSSKQINAPIVKDAMKVELSAFVISRKGDEIKYKRYVVARNEQLNFPIVVYRNGGNDYTALLLRCSHQFSELNVNGELLTCAAHGSEFDNKGNVVNGPADSKLRTFQTTTDDQHIYIQLV